VTFNSWVFALFFIIVLALYYHLRWRAQNVMLLIASLIFYGWWDWRFLGLLLLSAGIDYLAGLGMDGATPQRRRTLLIVSMCSNLGILGAFKYFGFFADSFAAVLGAIGLRADLPTLHIVLPVGISFYTFQSMSYTIDVYRGRLKPIRDPLLFYLFVGYFPQLVAGPIERATNLLPQLAAPRRVTADLIASGTLLLLVGLARKVLIADNVAPLVDEAFSAPSAMGSFQLASAIALFAIQIYCDFAGYSDMARGMSRLLGIELMENFRRPYFATTITDFWRRWHISLSTWLRDYLYIPLGGNRKGDARTYVNLLLTMLLGGLWHGASWTFVAWGALHGGALAVHKLWVQLRASLGVPAGVLGYPGRVASWSLTMAAVCAGWVFFRASDFAGAAEIFRGLVSGRDGHDMPWVLALLRSAALVAFLDVPQQLHSTPTALLRWPVLARGIAYAALILAIAIFGGDEHVPFIYFQF
jgi:D-alanyl-lipoteichoic acid acyltransferase DltB (MBOAT superfamily)